MNQKGKETQMDEHQETLFDKLYEDRKDSAKIFEKPSMEGVKKTIIEKYSKEAHFVYELLQNADDARATKVRFVISKEGLIFAHNGSIPFTLSDVENEEYDKQSEKLGHINAITSIAQSSKSEGEIGKFGIGFKAVFQYTDTPEIYCPPFFFKIEQFFVPTLLQSDHSERRSIDKETLFYFPFNLKKKQPEDAYNEITTRLKKLNHPLLFLKNLKRIEWRNEEIQWHYYIKEKIKKGTRFVSSISKEGDQRNIEKFLIFDKEIPSHINQQIKHRINIAFLINPGETKKLDSSKKYSPFCFFETQEQSPLKFIIQAPFNLNNSRESLLENDPLNKYFIHELAILLGESLPKIRDIGYLSIDSLNILPLSLYDMQGKFQPFFDIVLEKMKSEEKLLPTNLGDYTNRHSAIIARSKELLNLLGSKQLDELLGKKDIKWLDTSINEKNYKIWNFFTNKQYLDIDVIRPEGCIDSLSKKFLESQSDEWIIKLYIFLNNQQSLFQTIRKMPYIRIIKPKNERGERIVDHVVLFDPNGERKAFLPLENDQTNDFFPIVKKNIVQNSEAKDFLTTLGLVKPDAFDTIMVFLQRFPEEISFLSNKDYEMWLQRIIGYIKNSQINRIYEKKMEALKERMTETPLLYAVNCEGQTELKPPNNIYQSHYYSGSEELELFFEGNPDIWFLDPRYQNIADFSILIDFLEISYRPKIITDAFKVYQRHTKGFEHDYIMDGLDFFLKNQNKSLSASLYLWALLLQSQTDPKYKIEFSGTFHFANDKNFIGADVNHEEKTSTIYNLLTSHPWVPTKSLDFEYPSKVTEFHEDFDKLSKEWEEEYNILHKKLKFHSESKVWISVIEKVVPEGELREKIVMASELSIETLRKAKKIQEEEEMKKAQQITKPVQDEVHPKDELRKLFNRPQVKETIDFHHEDIPISDPDRRREIIGEEIQEAQKREPKSSDRLSYTLSKKWDGKNPEIRAFLLHEYGGKCQICSSSFYKRNGEPYFEGLYLIPYTKAEWLDREGNVLCLCPNCCAKMLHGSVIFDGDIVEFILEYKIGENDDSKQRDFTFLLCDKEEIIQFSDRHILDLQEIVKTDSKDP